MKHRKREREKELIKMKVWLKINKQTRFQKQTKKKPDEEHGAMMTRLWFHTEMFRCSDGPNSSVFDCFCWLASLEPVYRPVCTSYQ